MQAAIIYYGSSGFCVGTYYRLCMSMFVVTVNTIVEAAKETTAAMPIRHSCLLVDLPVFQSTRTNQSLVGNVACVVN